MEKYIVLEKQVGETPLSCAEAYRQSHPELDGVPMAYAGRLDPMASGKLLILLGDECKNQAAYHDLDKEYQFAVLFGVESDSLDVLGRLGTSGSGADQSAGADLTTILAALVGPIELPYPHFSAKTVQGKPLHVWTLENRLNEIDIPTRLSTIYHLAHSGTETWSRADLVEQALKKINSIPPVTDERKALGNDFRRADVRQDWERILTDDSLPKTYTIANFSCIASSGTYMRTLASIIATRLGTTGLAWSIQRTKIGRYAAAEKSWRIEY